MWGSLVSAILGALLTACASMVGRVLLALGLSFVTYQGFDVLMDSVNNAIKSNFDSMGGEVVNFLAFLWVDKAISVIFSAYAVAAGIKMGTSGTLKKLVRK